MTPLRALGHLGRGSELSSERGSDARVLPRLLKPGKSRASWLDKDTLLLGADLGDGDLTDSGYPRTVREWKRGSDPADAEVVFEGDKADVSVGGYVSRSRGVALEWRYRMTSFYTSKKQLRKHSDARDGVWHRLDALGLPDDAQISHLGNSLLIEPRSPLEAGGRTYAPGSYLACDLDDFVARGVRGATFRALFEPTATTSLAGASATKDRLILSLLDNVQSRLVFLEPVEAPGGPTTWKDAGSETSPTIRGVSCSPVDGEESNDYFLRTSTYLTPSPLRLADALDDNLLRGLRCDATKGGAGLANLKNVAKLLVLLLSLIHI